MQALMELEELQLFLRISCLLLWGGGGFVRLRLCRCGSREFFGNREVALRHFSRRAALLCTGGSGVLHRTFVLHDFRNGSLLSRPAEELYQQENDSCHGQRMKDDDQSADKVSGICIPTVQTVSHRVE